MRNLALAVLIGVIISALVFAWDNAKRIRARKYTDKDGVKYYEIYGPLFIFGSTIDFDEKFDILNDPEGVIIHFKESRVVDISAIGTLDNLTERYLKQGRKVHLRHLSHYCRQLIRNAESVIDVNVIEDPKYNVMMNA